jgi:hypothetical protein
MRKYLPLALAALFLVSCGKEKLPPPQPEQPVVKTVTFHVYAHSDYSHPYYLDLKADVVLNLHTINKRTGAITQVWDTTFAPRTVALYPQQTQMYVVEKNLPVLESTHKLNGGYGIKYDYKGSLNQEHYAEDLISGQKNLVVEARL